MLVAIGYAVLMTVTLNFAFGGMTEDGGITLDSTRLIEGIVGCIGFLGAVRREVRRGEFQRQNMAAPE